MIPRFRAWDKKTETIQEIESISFKEKKLVIDQKSVTWFNSDYIRNFDEVELMQSTGLKDKNGVEIFEGDLVEHDDNLNGDWETFEACEVVYDKDYAQFCFKWDAGNFLTDYRNLNVIGNIYENSELLEEQR